MLISWQRGFPQRMSQKLLVLSLVRPVLALMKAILTFLILARGSEVSSGFLETIITLIIIMMPRAGSGNRCFVLQ